MNTGNYMTVVAGINTYYYEELQEDWTGVGQVDVINFSSHNGFALGDVRCWLNSLENIGVINCVSRRQRDSSETVKKLHSVVKLT